MRSDRIGRLDRARCTPIRTHPGLVVVASALTVKTACDTSYRLVSQAVVCGVAAAVGVATAVAAATPAVREPEKAHIVEISLSWP